MPQVGDRTITINVRALVDGLIGPMKQAETSVKSFGTTTQTTVAKVEASTERIPRLWRAALEALIGVAVIDQLKNLALGAAEAADELDVASRVAKNFGNSLNAAAMEQWLQMFAKSSQGGGYAIDSMREAVDQFAAVGLQGAAIQRALADTADLAAAHNMSFAEATNVVRMALTGHVEMLTRYGVISREAAKGIKTVDDAMRALEKSTAGAASERANGLVGEFGRLSTAASLLANAIGKGLEPFFSELTTILTNLADAVGKIPAPIMQFVATFGAAGVSLTAFTLMLPAITKGLAIIKESFLLLMVPVVIGSVLEASVAFATLDVAALAPMLAFAAVAAAVAVALAALDLLIQHTADVKKAWSDFCKLLVDEFRILVANIQSEVRGIEADLRPIVDAVRTVATAVAKIWGDFVRFLHDAWEAFVNAFGPMVAKVVEALGGIAAALKPVSSAWDSFCSFLSDRFGKFVDKLKGQSDEVKGILAALVPPIGIALASSTLADRVKGSQTAGTRADAGKVGGDAHKLFGDFSGDLKKIVDGLKGLFTSSLSSVAVPSAHFPGTIPGKSGADAAAAAAENALRNFDEKTKNWLAEFQARVDKAKSIFDVSQEQLADFDVKHPADQGLSETDQAARQKLVNDELAAESSLRAKTLEQQKAEAQAADEYLKIAKEISPTLKNHDALVRQSLDAAREHSKAARDLYLSYLQAGTALDSIIAKERQAANERIDAAVAAQNAAGEQGLTGRNTQRDIRGEEAAQPLALEKAKGITPKPADEDRLAIALAQLAVAAAVDTEALKQHELATARQAYDRTHSTDDANRLADAQNALTEATLNVVKAEDARAVDEQKLVTDQRSRWTDLIDELVQKAGVPGLTSQGGVQSFNPLQFLVAAFEQSQTFADVMGTVNAIMKVFVQVFNAFRPVIDALLQVVRGVVNVFIFLYDAVAHILNLFGLQIPIIQALNSAFYDMVPLISITHDIPTLNELAAGKLNSPLSTTPVGMQQLNQTTQSGDMKIIEILAVIFGALVVEKMLSGLSFQQGMQQTLHLIGINVGQKVAAATAETGVALTNTILTSGFAEVVAAIEASAAASGGGGILGAILGLGGAAATGGASLGFAAMASAAVGPLRALGSAAQQVGAALSSAVRTVQDGQSALSQFVNSVRTTSQQIDASVHVAAPVTIGSATIQNPQDLAELSKTLSQDITRGMGVRQYGLDRALLG
jgi:hypothetical protein